MWMSSVNIWAHISCVYRVVVAHDFCLLTTSTFLSSSVSLRYSRYMKRKDWAISLFATSAQNVATSNLKGQCHEIFDFWFISWISFPQAPECTITAILNFFENSLRYFQLKVHHRCCWHRRQMEKMNGKWKILIILFGHLWVVELIYIYKCLPSSSL